MNSPTIIKRVALVKSARFLFYQAAKVLDKILWGAKIKLNL